MTTNLSGGVSTPPVDSLRSLCPKELWFNICSRYANIPIVLMEYRVISSDGHLSKQHAYICSCTGYVIEFKHVIVPISKLLQGR